MQTFARYLLPSTFHFSWKVTLVCFILATVMVRCSFWQWDRYKKKVALLETYASDSTTPPLSFPGQANADMTPYLHHRVTLSGRYDFERQVIVTNKRQGTGPGHALLTPLIIDGTDTAILISRGFIPFTDMTPDTWGKYDEAEKVHLQGIVKPAIRGYVFGPSNPEVGANKPFATRWLFEDIQEMAKQLPYPVISTVYIQRIGAPVGGEYPAEMISVEVPPRVHFGYTIEWAILAIVTLVIGYVLQAFPWYRGSSRGGH